MVIVTPLAPLGVIVGFPGNVSPGAFITNHFSCDVGDGLGIMWFIVKV
jgi:hypothetical protein